MTAICPVGPPKLMTPSFSQKTNASAKGTCRDPGASSRMCAPLSCPAGTISGDEPLDRLAIVRGSPRPMQPIGEAREALLDLGILHGYGERAPAADDDD